MNIPLTEDGKLNPWFVTGLTDGEGCFSLFLNTESRKRSNGNISKYCYWRFVYSIRLREDDKDILEKIAQYFGIGKVQRGTALSSIFQQVQYQIHSRTELIKYIVPHFDKYPLQAKKQRDYILWREGLFIMAKADSRRDEAIKRTKNPVQSQLLSEEEHIKLLELREQLAERVTGKKRDLYINVLRNKRRGKEIILDKRS